MAQQTGFPIGNFGIAGEIAPDGRMLPRVMYNPPVLGPWLEELGQGRFCFTCDGVTLADSDFEHARLECTYPEADVELGDPRFPGLRVSLSFLCPIKAGDALTSSIPAICASIEVTNSSDSERDFSVSFEFAHASESQVHICFDAATERREMEGATAVSARAAVPARASSRLRFLLVCHDTNGFYANTCPTVESLVSTVLRDWDAYWADRSGLIALLPRTHDEQIDRYLRWYLSAGVLLTRMTREHVLTLGYTELNQRDSYWTSWPHLVLWPDLERRMIEESADHQRENGKIPTTILPTIEREDDIDINCYFCLRIARYFEWTRDVEFLRAFWPSYKLSVDYLRSTDKDGDGLVDQGSFWADWKDVTGVEGRKAAPHFEFLWVAVLKYAEEFASILNDWSARDEYASLHERASSAVNADTDAGGLWNGRFYTTLWYDGREDTHCQQDQFVGPLYGVVPEGRIRGVFESIDDGMTDWGVRDTWPYREPFNNVGGDYHNGGVWVFLNFGDALSRFVTGFTSNAWEILKRVGYQDLERWGDYMPAEYLDGRTGENAGKPIQGWDADFFAAILFGALGLRVLGPGFVQVMPRIADGSGFETPVLLPSGVLHIKQTPCPDSLVVEIRSALAERVRVRYGAMTGRSAEGCAREHVGECEFAVVEVDLAPGTTRKLEFR